jgi:hypothetical protein
MASPQESRIPLVDALEILGLLIIPALLGGVTLHIISGLNDVVAGVVIGGVVGFSMARLRREFYAVRTADGIERRVRPVPKDNLWIRLANLEYDEKYDRLLAVVLFGLGIVSLATIPFVNSQSGLLILWLVLLGLFGLTTALMTYGSLQS